MEEIRLQSDRTLEREFMILGTNAFHEKWKKQLSVQTENEKCILAELRVSLSAW